MAAVRATSGCHVSLSLSLSLSLLREARTVHYKPQPDCERPTGKPSSTGLEQVKLTRTMNIALVYRLRGRQSIERERERERQTDRQTETETERQRVKVVPVNVIMKAFGK